MTDDLDFWMVWRAGGFSPTVKHPTRRAAEDEAICLSHETNDRTAFFVLKAVSSHVRQRIPSGLTVDEANALREQLAKATRDLESARGEKRSAVMALEKMRDEHRMAAEAAVASGHWTDTAKHSTRAVALNDAVQELEGLPF